METDQNEQKQCYLNNNDHLWNISAHDQYDQEHSD